MTLLSMHAIETVSFVVVTIVTVVLLQRQLLLLLSASGHFLWVESGISIVCQMD